jgi:hypothetical protein
LISLSSVWSDVSTQASHHHHPPTLMMLRSSLSLQGIPIRNKSFHHSFSNGIKIPPGNGGWGIRQTVVQCSHDRRRWTGRERALCNRLDLRMRRV